MAEDKCAMAEAVIASIVADDVDQLSVALSTTADPDTWRAVLRYELPIDKLVDVDGLLHYDVFASKLLCLGCARTLTPWHVAGLRGADDAISMFVKQLSFPVDCLLPSSGVTALQLACFAGHTDTVRKLIDQLQSDVNRRDKYGWTALHYAAAEGQFDIVELLLARDVDVRARDKDGVTAAYRATAAGHQDVACLMQSLTDNDDLLLTAQPDDEIPTERLYANVRKPAMTPNTTGRNVIKLGESEYLLASGSGTGEMTTTAELVRRVVSEQVRDVLGDNDDDTYIAPVSSPSVASPRVDNISYNTLTRVVREELRRFRADVESARFTASSHSEHQLPPHSSSYTATGRGDGGYEEIDDVINAINHHDHATEVSGAHGDNDDVLQQAPPVPPQRHDSSSTASSARCTVDVSSRPAVTGPPRASVEMPVGLAGDSVRRRTVAEDMNIIQLLERIEQSSAALDSSFTALVNVGMRCPGDWQRLARELPMCKPAKLNRRIALIEARYRGDIQRQAAAALAEWRSYRRDNATIDELTAALRRCDLLEEAQLLNTMSQESTS